MLLLLNLVEWGETMGEKQSGSVCDGLDSYDSRNAFAKETEGHISKGGVSPFGWAVFERPPSCGTACFGIWIHSPLLFLQRLG